MSEHTLNSTGDYVPRVPPAVRTAVYVAALIGGFFIVLALAVAVPLWPEHAGVISTAALGTGSALGWLCAALGVAYNPTTHPVGAPAGRHSAPEEL